MCTFTVEKVAVSCVDKFTGEIMNNNASYYIRDIEDKDI